MVGVSGLVCECLSDAYTTYAGGRGEGGLGYWPTGNFGPPPNQIDMTINK